MKFHPEALPEVQLDVLLGSLKISCLATEVAATKNAKSTCVDSRSFPRFQSLSDLQPGHDPAFSPGLLPCLRSRRQGRC
jgi:hypothetical protein